MGKQTRKLVLGSSFETGSHAARTVSFLLLSSLTCSLAQTLTHCDENSKMESFIRSKYELKRWAMEGPPPDPETLESGSSSSVSPNLLSLPSASCVND